MTTPATTPVTTRASLWEALGSVRDPELDEPVTDLGFVSECTCSEGVARVRLRLLTYFCAPNFAFLMVADAYDALAGVSGVVRVDVALDDHFASEAINAGVAARAGFVEAFDGQAADELDELRADFLRKAVLAGTDRVCRPLLAAGWSAEDLAGATLGQMPDTAELSTLRARRRDVGLPAGDDAPLLVDATTGEAVGVDALPLHLRRTRLTRVNTEANSSICRGMLAHRYPDHPLEEAR